MSERDDEFDAQLAEPGDDRPGLDDLDEVTHLALSDLDEDDDEDDDYPEDATEDDIDLVVALYTEDGRHAALAMPTDLANDFDGLIEALRRVPGEAGAVGVVSIDDDFFVIARVRGTLVQVLLSDDAAANDWPIARDAADYLGVDIPDDDEDDDIDGVPVGDLDLFTDVGLSAFELEALCSDPDAEPLDMLDAIVEKLGFADAYEKAVATFDE